MQVNIGKTTEVLQCCTYTYDVAKYTRQPQPRFRYRQRIKCSMDQMVLACVLGVRRGPPNGLLRLLRQSVKVMFKQKQSGWE